MALLKMGLLERKVLLFVNGIDAGFRLRLFLECFGIRAAVLNAELPLNSRHHILQAIQHCNQAFQAPGAPRF
jgi:ATP-dependent RNA helicase DDX56/DBP9